MTLSLKKFTLLILIASSADSFAILPLRDQWRAANLALSQNQPEAAVNLFREFDEWYAEEDVARNPEFREKLNRLWGLSALQAGSLIEGIERLESWLKEFPDAKHFRAFILFQLASAHIARGDPVAARNHWAVFIDEYPNLPECLLVRWLWAESLLAESKLTQAIPQFEEIASSGNLPESARILAKSALALTLLAEGRVEQALRQLDIKENGHAGQLWKAIMAPALADALLRNGKPKLAMSSSEWFNSTANLLRDIKQLRKAGSGQQSSIRARIWGHHWQNQVSKAVSSLRTSIESGLDINSLYLLRLKTYIKAGSTTMAFHLAKLLLETKNPKILIDREKVYGFAIEACMQSDRWKFANQLAQAFLTEYPKSPELPAILFLQARCAASQKNWSDALDAIVQLMSEFPEHPAIAAWKFAHIQWLAQAGRWEAALEALLGFKGDCPEDWLDYLELEQANCLNQLQQTSEAKTIYAELMSTSRYPAIAEQANIALLKISLNQLNWSDFQSHRDQFIEKFPYSQNQIMVDLLLGSFMEFTNNPDKAIDIYHQVSRSEGPMADHARHQLSRLFSAEGEHERLRAHALQWILAKQDHSHITPLQPWVDCLQYQQISRKPALQESELKLFLEEFLKGSSVVHCGGFLDLLENQWPAYSRSLASGQHRFIDWVSALATKNYASGQITLWTKLALHQADILMRHGRLDSSDTIRIRVLSRADLDDLDQAGLFKVASVAHKYDFPESGRMLERFVDEHANSPMTPHCLLMLAMETEAAGDTKKSITCLQTITTDWKDSEIYKDAALKLANLYYRDHHLQQARIMLDTLLQENDLPPPKTAESLLLRAWVDFQSGALETSRLSCERILALYPDIKEVSTGTHNLMNMLNET